MRIIPARAGFTIARQSRASPPRDHPRSRGVYVGCRTPSRRGIGSSPLARGLLPGHGRGHAADGIIPARAGFTMRRSRSSAESADHPRSRGVYASVTAIGPLCRGSSPLARGLRDHPGCRRAGRGIIPARAGFTRIITGATCAVADHPRSRGVYLRPGEWRVLQDGSSPLARGLRERETARRAALGIIPARAGFTDGDRRVRARRSGSSPLARGLPIGALAAHDAPRIIPARAGFTRRGRRSGRPRRDHPRSRGVYWPSPAPTGPGPGSSPLARGLPPGRARGQCGRRIIPARAGFTDAAHRAARGTQDHPRSRGVYWALDVSERGREGSSPLARGLHAGDRSGRVEFGIIPARAGFTSGAGNPERP